MVNNIKIDATVLVAISLFFCVSAIAQAGTYSGGTGTENDPYLVATAAALQAIGANPADWDKHFMMTANIDLSAYDGQNGNPAFNIIAPVWASETDPDRRQGALSVEEPPIPPFTGTFDGNEHIIYNFSYTVTSGGYVGLFGRVGGEDRSTWPPTAMPGTIKNLGLENASVSAITSFGVNSYAGCLAGHISYGSTISRCYVNGSVGGSYAVAGGLVGVSYGSTITNSYSNIQAGGYTVGGIVGENNGGVISNCYSNADIGADRAGGLVGGNDGGTISNCYATGNIYDDPWGAEVHGGLVGYNSEGSIEYCYSTVHVSNATYAGGLVGSNSSGDLIPPSRYTGCFWNTDVNPLLSDAGGFPSGIDLFGVVGETTTNMQMRTTFTSVGWDFAVETINGEDDIWTIDEGVAYPDLGLAEYVGGVDGGPNDLDIYYVDGSAVGNNDGSSWADAFAELQSALDAAVAGDEIRVADGTYKPSVEVGGSGSRYRTFQLKNGVTVGGGYAGRGAVDPNERNFELYETILSGNIGTLSAGWDNCYHIFYHPEGLALDPNAVLDGFTITGGNADGDYPHNHGGGMHNNSCNPTIISCIFTGSYAGYGGGGVFNINADCVVITGCSFKNNSAKSYGAGIMNRDSNSTITKCHFTGNFVTNSGGAIFDYLASNSVISNCVFIDNTAGYYGGAMTIGALSGTTVANCVFVGNSTTTYSGGAINATQGTSLTLLNCFISENYAEREGGAISMNAISSMDIINCILMGNIAGTSHNEIYTLSGNTPDISYSDIEGCGSSGGGWDDSLGIDGGGNIDADPLFERYLDDGGDGWGDKPYTHDIDEGANDDYGGLRLQAGSPCIDAGDPNYIANPNATDLDGLERIVDGDCDLTATVDMGACEFDWKYLGDFAGGCDVDMEDFAVLAENWEESNAGADIVPYHEGDGVIDLGELMVLAENWLEGVGPAPLVTGWQTAVEHGDAGVLVSDIEDGFVECRVNGITKLKVCFDQAMDTSVVDPAMITIDGVSGGAQAEPCSIAWETDRCMAVTLYAALGDEDTYTITVSDSVVSAEARAVGGDRDICITALAGDADLNGLVDGQDLSAVNGYVSEPVNEANCRYDINCNGLINSQDLLAVNARDDHAASGCE